MEVKNEQLYSNDSFIINDYVDIYTVKDGKCNVCYKCFGSFPRAMFNFLNAELTWRDMKMITIHVFDRIKASY